MNTAVLDAAFLRRRDWQTILLIGVAHACSHFFQLVIPTLYVSLGEAFGLDFASLGLLVSVFFVISGVGQASSGFVVDRVGALPVMWFGLGSFVASGLLIGAANGYAMLVAAAALGGLGNAVFHPVDYSLINHRISQARLGHAYSTHGLTGTLGWALTPVFITSITMLAGWRAAAFAAAALAAAVLVLTVLGRRLLSNDAGRAAAPAATAAAASPDTSQAPQSAWRTLCALVSRPALWGAFLFFACTSISLSAVQSYTIPLLGEIYGLSQVAASSALSGYMVASALGMAAGGFLVSATPRAERTVMLALILAGLTLVLLSSGWVPGAAAALVVALAGFCSGVAGPSRDMLIRRVTPRGATGSVYGLVYSGMDVGSALGPLGFGLMLDAGWAHGPWLGAGATFVAGALLAQWIGRQAATAVPSAGR